MASIFKLKTQTTKGVDVTSPVAQAAEIASLIGATSFVVDIVENNATLNTELQTYVVTAGQVISITSGVVSIQSRESFYEIFEEQDPI